MTHAASEVLYRQAVSLLSNRHAADTVCALTLLQQAAGQGHAQAAAELSRVLAGGRPSETKPDPETTHALLREKEARGIPFAQLLNGYAWLAESGHRAAQLRLLAYHAAQNDGQAPYWAELAAAHGQAEAHLYLAQRQCETEQPNWARAAEHYRAAAEAGSIEADWQLGQIHRHGYGGLLQPDTAAHYLHRAAEAGITAARTALAQVLAAQNRPEAIAHYRTAAEAGDACARAEWAEHLLTGRLCERDFHAALRHAQIAAEAHQPEALRVLGDIYRYGLGVKADTAHAAEYYRQAAEAGSLAAYQKCLSDAALYRPDQYEAIKAAALVCQQAEQHYRRGFALQYALAGRTDLAAARKHYLAASESGHRAACTALGALYEQGRGVRADMAQAAYWYESAAEQGCAEAQYRLALMYREGRGVVCSTALACEWLQTAADNGAGNAAELAALLAEWQQEAAAESARYDGF